MRAFSGSVLLIELFSQSFIHRFEERYFDKDPKSYYYIRNVIILYVIDIEKSFFPTNIITNITRLLYPHFSYGKIRQYKNVIKVTISSYYKTVFLKLFNRNKCYDIFVDLIYPNCNFVLIIVSCAICTLQNGVIQIGNNR